MDIKKISSDLQLTDDGIWCSEKTSIVSYPEIGNEACFNLEDNSFWFKHRNECIKSVITKYLVTLGQPTLDVGGGNGFVTKNIQDLGIPVALIEPGLIGAKNAIRRGVKTVICSTFENAGIADSSIAGIGIFDVIEHIEDDATFLQRLHQSLVTDGKLFITVPAYQWLWSGEDVEAGHFRRYSIKSLSATVRENGFKIEYTSYFFSFLPLAIFLMRCLPYRLGFVKGTTIQKHIKAHRRPKLDLIQKIVDRLLDSELKIINSNRRCRFGGSIILVASKEEG